MMIKKRDGHYVVEFKEDGKRRRFKFLTKNEAEVFQLQKTRESAFVRPNTVGVSLLDALEDYRDFRRPDFDHRSFLRFRSHLREIHRTLEAAGVEDMSELTNVTMDKALSIWRKKYSASTTNRHVGAIKPFLARALRLGLISREIVLKKVAEDNVSREPWTPSEEFMNEVIPHLKAPLRFIQLTGCRPIEACNLRVGDLDRRRGACLRSKKGNRSSERWLPLVGELETLVSDSIKGRERNLDALVFLNKHGRPIIPVRISDEVRRVRQLLNLPDTIVPYGQRHHVITSLLENGMPIHEVQAIAGHRKMSTTQKYAHPKDDGIRRGLMLIQGGAVWHESGTKTRKVGP